MINLTAYNLKYYDTAREQWVVIWRIEKRLTYAASFTPMIPDEDVYDGLQVYSRTCFPKDWELPPIDTPVIIQSELLSVFKNHRKVYMVNHQDSYREENGLVLVIKSLIRVEQ
jgi:hypothetical protein